MWHCKGGLICNDYNVYSNVRRQQSQTILPSGRNSSKPKVHKKAQVLLDGQQPAKILRRVKQSTLNRVTVPKLNPGSNQRHRPPPSHGFLNIFHQNNLGRAILQVMVPWHHKPAADSRHLNFSNVLLWKHADGLGPSVWRRFRPSTRWRSSSNYLRDKYL